MVASSKPQRGYVHEPCYNSDNHQLVYPCFANTSIRRRIQDSLGNLIDAGAALTAATILSTRFFATVLRVQCLCTGPLRWRSLHNQPIVYKLTVLELINRAYAWAVIPAIMSPYPISTTKQSGVTSLPYTNIDPLYTPLPNNPSLYYFKPPYHLIPPKTTR